MAFLPVRTSPRQLEIFALRLRHELERLSVKQISGHHSEGFPMVFNAFARAAGWDSGKHASESMRHYPPLKGWVHWRPRTVMTHSAWRTVDGRDLAWVWISPRHLERWSKRAQDWFDYHGVDLLRVPDMLARIWGHSSWDEALVRVAMHGIDRQSRGAARRMSDLVQTGAIDAPPCGYRRSFSMVLGRDAMGKRIRVDHNDARRHVLVTGTDENKRRNHLLALLRHRLAMGDRMLVAVGADDEVEQLTLRMIAERNRQPVLELDWTQQATPFPYFPGVSSARFEDYLLQQGFERPVVERTRCEDALAIRAMSVHRQHGLTLFKLPARNDPAREQAEQLLCACLMRLMLISLEAMLEEKPFESFEGFYTLDHSDENAVRASLLAAPTVVSLVDIVPRQILPCAQARAQGVSIIQSAPPETLAHTQGNALLANHASLICTSGGLRHLARQQDGELGEAWVRRPGHVVRLMD